MTDQNPKPTFQPDTLFRFKFLQKGKISPDGKKMVYGVSRLDVEKDQEFANLWLLDLETYYIRQLTFGDWSDSQPDWSPDGEKIAFLSTRSGKAQIYVMHVDGGEARELVDLPGIGGGPHWSPDGEKIAFTAAAGIEKMPEPGKPYRVTRLTYRFDGMGLVEPILQSIYTLPAEGGEAKRLFEDEAHSTLQGWSPDGKFLLFTSAFGPEKFCPFEAVLKLADLDGNLTTLNSGWGNVTKAIWLPDNKQILFAGTPAGKPIGSKEDLWLTDIHDKTPVCRTENLEYGVLGGLQGDMSASTEGAVFTSPDGSKAYCPVQKGGTVQLYEINLSGPESWRICVGGERCCIPVGLAGERLVYGAATMNRAPDFFSADLQGENEERLTRLNCKMLQEHAKVSVEPLLFKSVDGTEVEGWFMKPPYGEAPYPTILYIHGGPHSAFGYTFSFDFQMLAGAGYGVLFINHRASLGYGDAFSTAIKGDWGYLDYQDLMYGVDFAIEKGLADPDKLGVCGISGGGNLSCWIVGNTQRFKAAVPENPVTNWVSMYGVSDLGAWFAVEELGGHPHEIPEVYKKCSPVSYAHTCSTPTLLVQGESDQRCPPEQSEQFYTILKANGCITEMLRLPNSPHPGSIVGPPSLRRAQNEALLDWMNRYVLGLTPQSEKSEEK